METTAATETNTPPTQPLSRPGRREAARRWGGRLRRAVPPVVGVAVLGGLLALLNPAQVGRAIARFELALVAPILLLYVAIYLLQGLRWHLLLVDAGARLRLRDSLLLNAAGQAITALVPLGDLTRALFASQAARADLGRVAATVTVQELTYTLTLVMLALPVLLQLHVGVAAVLVTVLGIAGIVAILTVSPVFCAVHRVVARIPLLRGLLPAIEELQHETAYLLHRPDTLAWSVLDLARAAVSVSVLWLVVRGLSPDSLDWWRAAFVLSLASIGGAVSLIPGGAGANEAGVAGLLLLFGLDPGAAGAAAVLQRFLMTGTALAFGFSAYAVARRRFPLGGAFQVTAHRPQRLAA